MNNIKFVIVALCIFRGSLPAADTNALKPNIVYFLADDMGYADVGFNGCRDFLTPNIDALARKGTVLTSLYGQPVCSPTRAALMTGRYPTHTGVYNVVSDKSSRPLPLAERTLAEALHQLGYVTAICGKWHLGADPEYTPTRRGFDHQYGFMLGSINSFNQIAENQKRDWYRDDQPCADAGYSMEMISREACRLIREQPLDKPLFLYVPFNGVHTPWLSRDEDKAPYASLQGRRKELAGITTAVDTAIGQIMAALDAKALTTNTLIIFSSDNGGPSWDRVVLNTPLRGGKADIYEGGVRLCACVAWPGKVPAGATNSEPVHVVDWYPTLLKLTGADAAQKLAPDGRDIWPVLAGGAKFPEREILLMGSVAGQSAIRIGDWKLLVNPWDRAQEGKGRGNSGRVELYNLITDPGEKSNLAAEQPERVKTMRARLDELKPQPANPDYLQSPKGRKGKAESTAPDGALVD